MSASHAGSHKRRKATRVRTGAVTPRQSSSFSPPESTDAVWHQLSDLGTAPSKATFTPVGPFPFMRLPAELRVHIYRMALQSDDPLILHLPRLAERLEDELRTTTIDMRIARTIERNSRPSPVFDGRMIYINAALLRSSSLVYKEARQVLYADNEFILSLASGIHTLSALHQRSRSLIKSVRLTIPSHHDILDGFADLVRLGLRYCWGLKKFTIILQSLLPDDRVMSGATSVYANAFHILRWLPQGCKVVLQGNVSAVVKRVVADEGRLQEQLDETSYLKRQHQMPERH
ncbi:hypothetical protein BDV95DRAFT_503967 [Massariosphaeria phaeospora]|uniref:DUF7730 domain-containing protein n=1 Tax=Massariosphaeria phaeospora TaxID=100035 RepID=A0A7C8M3D3_9PLEO|nr:hypothetical protein BDV95DRAFT_503967 [Massariosphaeria phaeospora]